MKPNYRILGVYFVGVFIGALDTNVLGPVFPLITKSFHIVFGWTAWTITAYTVAYIASTILAGAAGDRFGHRKLFTWGIFAFGLASLLAALSQNFSMFIVARVIQGAGAGAVYPNAQAEGLKLFPANRRGMALGLFGAIFGIASMFGPTAGGALGQYFGWPAVFVINIPIAIVVLGLVRRVPQSEMTSRTVPDVVGGLGFAAFLASILLFITAHGSVRWLFLVLAAVCFTAFWIRQRTATNPFLDSKPLTNKAGIAVMIGAALIGLDMSAAIFVPTLTQVTLHFSILVSGVALLPAAFTGAVFSGAGGVMVDRIGPRKVLVAGLLAAAIGGLLLALPHLVLWRFIVAMVALGIGTAFTMGAPLNKMALGLYREDQAGEALSLMAVFRGIGLAAGPILLTAAEVWHGFSGMFGSVFLASLVGLVAFWFVPDVEVVKPKHVVET